MVLPYVVQSSRLEKVRSLQEAQVLACNLLREKMVNATLRLRSGEMRKVFRSL